MSHENSENRDFIFKTLNNSIATEFNEDNSYTRFYFTIICLLKNDKLLLEQNPNYIISNAEDAISDVFSKRVTW